MGSGSQHQGAALEDAFKQVLDQFLHEVGFVVDEIRLQPAGSQPGNDIYVRLRRSHEERAAFMVLFECKNYTSPVRLREFIDKPFQAQERYGDIDLWVLVSPKTEVAADADASFASLQSRFPFPLIKLTPDEGIASLLALYPDAYRTIYGEEPPPEFDREAVFARWKEWFLEQLCLTRHLQLPHAGVQVVDPVHIAALRPADPEALRKQAEIF